MSSHKQFCKTMCQEKKIKTKGKSKPVTKKFSNGYLDNGKIDDFFFPLNDCNSIQSYSEIEKGYTTLSTATELNHLDQKGKSKLNGKITNNKPISSDNVGYLNMSPCRELEKPFSTSLLDGPYCNGSCKPVQVSTTMSVGSNKKFVKSKKITSYYSVRRSSRRTKSVIKKENENQLIDAVLSNKEDGLQTVIVSDKGRGVIATRNFFRNEFIVEYAGDLISWTEAKKREHFYGMDSSIGCYMYYFTTKGQNYCIDATAESGKLGRLLNHSRKNPNCYTKLVWVPNKLSNVSEPRIVILAKQNILKGEELTYDYGDRDRKSLQLHPWLKT